MAPEDRFKAPEDSFNGVDYRFKATDDSFKAPDDIPSNFSTGSYPSNASSRITNSNGIASSNNLPASMGTTLSSSKGRNIYCAFRLSSLYWHS